MYRWIAGLVPLLLLPAAVQAACLDTVDRLSSQYGLETRPAEPQQQASSLTEKLKGSGGVIKPPEVGAPAAIRPPETGSAMPTAPAVKPQTSEGAAKADRRAAKTAQIEALLTAARGAAERGNESECQARLDEAQQLAATDEAKPQ